jgi:Sec-independent protein secretion pathway component TatC
MERRRWLNQGQPQTLVIACFLLYFNAAFTVLIALGTSFSGVRAVDLLPVLAGVLGAYGIANERRWGYYLAIAVAFLPFVLAALINSNHNPFGGAAPLTLVFEIALVALLLHTQSREYEKVWFK